MFLDRLIVSYCFVANEHQPNKSALINDRLTILVLKFKQRFGHYTQCSLYKLPNICCTLCYLILPSNFFRRVGGGHSVKVKLGYTLDELFTSRRILIIHQNIDFSILEAQIVSNW